MAEIVQTNIVITATDTEYQVPGSLSVSQVVAAYSSQIPGLSGYQASEEIVTREGIGQVRVITFRPKTGTKG